MDIKNWRRSISTRSTRLGKHYDNQQQPAASENNSNKIKLAPWKVLWRKFLKEKKNMFASSSSGGGGGRVHVQSPYDYETYMQNFDEGQNSLIEEPDVMFRSFSMRFADPSKLFPDQKDLILI